MVGGSVVTLLYERTFPPRPATVPMIAGGSPLMGEAADEEALLADSVVV